jgi:isoleucyl-tRNA synthetase
VKKADGTKCNRCWFYDDQVGKHDLTYDGVCQRCNKAISTWEEVNDEKFVLEVEEEPTVV